MPIEDEIRCQSCNAWSEKWNVKQHGISLTDNLNDPIINMFIGISRVPYRDVCCMQIPCGSALQAMDIIKGMDIIKINLLNWHLITDQIDMEEMWVNIYM